MKLQFKRKVSKTNRYGLLGSFAILGITLITDPGTYTAFATAAQTCSLATSSLAVVALALPVGMFFAVRTYMQGGMTLSQ